MAMDADFSHRRKSVPRVMKRSRGRDHGHLFKPIGPSADKALFEELVHIVNEAQERDAEDERRLFHPLRGDRPSSYQGRRLEPR